MKKILNCLCIIVLSIIVLTGCTKNESVKNIDMSSEEIITKLYEGISAEDMPMVFNTALDSENVDYYLGTDKVKFKEAVASEPQMSSIAYSVVVVKLEDGENIENAKKLIKDSVNPAKWMCVDAEIVKVENIGNTVLLIMMDELNEELANKILNNFNNLK